jgi:transcriptional regulator with XRE-family HTH domain
MPRPLSLANSAPLAVSASIEQLGARLKLARTRRRVKLRDLAARAGVAYDTARAAERGNLSTSIAVYVALAWALGLEKEFAALLDPGQDIEGLALEQARSPLRVRGPAPAGFEEDF